MTNCDILKIFCKKPAKKLKRPSKEPENMTPGWKLNTDRILRG
jgi:hypothetical protein